MGYCSWANELENLADEIDEKGKSLTNDEVAIGYNHAADFLRDRASQYKGFALSRRRQELKTDVFIPDAYANLYPEVNGRMYWTLHDNATIAYDCEEPGAKFVAVPVSLSKGRKPTGSPPEKTCGNCANREDEECSLHGGREIYIDEKPSWCLDWIINYDL
jgi:hypothetical protein